MDIIAELTREVGRPSGYDDMKLAKAKQYVENHMSLGDPVPTVEGLADELGVSRQTVYSWGDSVPAFLDTLERLKVKQGRLLQARGLEGKFAPVITKLMLSANHGMAEKSENKQENTGTITVVTKVPVPNGDNRA